MEWLLASTAPNAFSEPRAVRSAMLDWVRATVPGTVAQALRNAGRWDWNREQNFDDQDWWYRCEWTTSPGEIALQFHGLATLAQVWLNDELVLESDNMFEQHTVPVTLRETNELLICFRSLTAELKKRRPRPRWKTRLVPNQQLRWFRTTLLGRMPGWSPPVAPVGPWRPIVFERRREISNVALSTSLDGTVDFSCVLSGAARVSRAELRIGDASTPLRIDGDRATAQLQIKNPKLWWPHTHGTPSLYACSAHIGERTYDLGHIAFRSVEAIQSDGDFALRINGVPIFCRGACWTVSDIVSLGGDTRDYAATLQRVRDAGGNMVRVGGTFVYETDAFYGLCDELGILVWHDFMFANMDYPSSDAKFVESVKREATQQIARFRRHPSVVVLCGNSEVEQQAAMVGAPREIWRNEIFSNVLPKLCDETHVYVPSTPSGGTMPFHTRTGLTHYYGVGAYMRPISDVRRASVRFTPETLGFANVPEKNIIDEVMEGDAPATHDARWKRRTPRDTGAAWDFEDVRDHYLEQLFARNAIELRRTNMPRYLDLSRATTGEVMSQVFSEWRSAYSTCHGALVWLLKDMWAGAGWGVLDSRGNEKACFAYLRRVWQPQTVVITDEGLSGLHLHVVNEKDEVLHATLDLTLLRDGHVVVAHGTTSCEVPPRSIATHEAEKLLDGFFDSAYAYRFGPPNYEVAAATLHSRDSVMAEAFHFPLRGEPRSADGATVTIEACTNRIAIHTDRFLYGVHFDGAVDDNYFHLVPGRKKSIAVTAPPAFIEAINLSEPIAVKR